MKIILSLIPYGIMFSIMFAFAMDNVKLRMDIQKKREEGLMLCMEIERLRHLLNCQTYHNDFHRNKSSNNKISPEMVEAVKFAMTKAHPDNPGGSDERFIKYKKLYDEISRR